MSSQSQMGISVFVNTYRQKYRIWISCSSYHERSFKLDNLIGEPLVPDGLCSSPSSAFRNLCCHQYTRSRWTLSALGLLESVVPQAPASQSNEGFAVHNSFRIFTFPNSRITSSAHSAHTYLAKTELLLVVNSSYPPHMTHDEYKRQHWHSHRHTHMYVYRPFVRLRGSSCHTSLFFNLNFLKCLAVTCLPKIKCWSSAQQNQCESFHWLQ